MLSFRLLILLLTSVVTKTIGSGAKQCLPSKITAITSFKNGTVFIASNEFYWLLDNNTMDQINDHSRGLVKNLIPGMNSVQMAVSLRRSLDGSQTETLLFQTFEDNRNKLMVYRDNKWTDGRPLVQSIIELAFNRTVLFNEAQNKRTLFLCFTLGVTYFYVLYGTDGNAIYNPTNNNVWYIASLLRPDPFANKSFDSIWVKEPDSGPTDNFSYVVFSKSQYYECNMTTLNTNFVREVCDSNKRDISQLFKCLSPPIATVVMANASTTVAKEPGLSNHGFKQTSIVILIVILVVAFIVLIVIIFVYCKCLKALIALKTEKEKSDPNVTKDNLQKDLQKETLQTKDVKQSVILSEVISKENQEKAINRPKPQMNARVNQIKGILQKSHKKKEKPKIPLKIPEDSKSVEHKQNQQNEHDQQSNESQTNEPQKRQFVGKDNKFKKNVQQFGRMLSEEPEKKPKKTTHQSEAVQSKAEPVSKVDDEKPKSQLKRTQPPSAVQQTTDDRLRQLMSQSPNDEDRVNQILSTTSTANPVSKQQDSRVEKLLKE